MANHRNRFPARRRFLKQSTALSATVALPHLARAAQPAPSPQEDSTPGAVPPAQPVRRTREPRR